MQPPSEHEELVKRFAPLVRQHQAAQQKLVKQRQALQELLGMTLARVKQLEASPDEPPQFLRFMLAQKQMIELNLLQLEAFHLDANVVEVVNTESPTYKARAMQMDVASFQMEQIIWSAFAADLQRDLPAVREQAEPVEGLPSAWLTVRKTLIDQPQEVEAWQQFADELPLFSEALDKFLVAADKVPTLAPQAALRAYEEFKLPALRGIRFRAESFARRVPGGLALLKAVAPHYIPFDVPAEPAATAPAAGSVLTTGRLGLGKFFRSNQKK